MVFAWKELPLSSAGYLRWKILNSAFLSFDTELFFSEAWPLYLQLPRYNSQGTLRSSNAPVIEIPPIKATFQYLLATLLNPLPTKNVRQCPYF